MSRRHHIPASRLHKQSGQAVVTLPDGLGRRCDVLLGKFGTPESRKEHARLLAEWEANGRRLPQPAAASDITVNELILACWRHARDYYGWAKEPRRGDKASIKDALRVVRKLHGPTLARDFGPLALKACRARMIRKGWARTSINAPAREREVVRLRFTATFDLTAFCSSLDHGALCHCLAEMRLRQGLHGPLHEAALPLDIGTRGIVAPDNRATQFAVRLYNSCSPIVTEPILVTIL